MYIYIYISRTGLNCLIFIKSLCHLLFDLVSILSFIPALCLHCRLFPPHYDTELYIVLAATTSHSLLAQPASGSNLATLPVIDAGKLQ